MHQNLNTLPPYFVIVYTTHHVSCHCLSKKFALIVTKTWPTPAGLKLRLSEQSWILPTSDLYSLPFMLILRHSANDNQIHVIHHHPHNLHCFFMFQNNYLNPLNAELNPICHLLALLGVHHFLHISRIRVNSPCMWRATVHFLNTESWGIAPRIQSMQVRSALYVSHVHVYLLSLRGCNILMYIPLPDDGQHRMYLSQVMNCVKLELVSSVCTTKTLDTDSIFT